LRHNQVLNKERLRKMKSRRPARRGQQRFRMSSPRNETFMSTSATQLIAENLTIEAAK